MPPKYVINNELTADALLTTDLLKSCSLTVGDPSAVRVSDEEDSKPKAQKKQYFQKFVEVSYPDGSKSTSMVIPGCVMHHTVHDYYKKSSIFVGIPQPWVSQVKLKLSTTGNSAIFEEKRIISTDKYWWVRISKNPAEVDKEFIRVVEDDSEEYYASFAELFTDFPSSLRANVTCSLKLKAEVDMDQALKGDEKWRAGITVSMFTPTDPVEVPAPTTAGSGQRSMAGQKDRASKGLLALRKKA